MFKEHYQRTPIQTALVEAERNFALAQDNMHKYLRDEMLVNADCLMALKLAQIKKDYASYL